MMVGVRTRQQFVLRIISPSQQRPPVDVAATTLEDLQDWNTHIQKASSKAEERVSVFRERSLVTAGGGEWVFSIFFSDSPFISYYFPSDC